MDVQQSGVKQHPFTFQQTGNECCLTPSIGEGVCQHKTAFNHNFLRDSWHGVQWLVTCRPCPPGMPPKADWCGDGRGPYRNREHGHISLCSMPSGSWIPQDKAQDRTGCLQWVPFTEETCLFTIIHQIRYVHSYHGLPDISLVPDSIKAGRACSSNIDRVLRIKIEIILWWFMLFTWIVERHISTHPYFCHVAFAINMRMRKTVPALFLLPLLRTWEWG